MFKTDALQRYEDYLNEMTGLAITSGLKNPDYYRTKHGVSAALFSFLKKKGIFYQKDDLWYTTKKGYYTTEEVSMLKNEFNRHKYHLKTNGTTEENPPVRFAGGDDPIRSFTTKALIDELKRRGYTGTIYIKKEIKL